MLRYLAEANLPEFLMTGREVLMISHINNARTKKMTAAMARPWDANPDELKRVIQHAVSSLGENQRAAYCRRLVAALSELGLDVPAILYVAGIVESEPADLTPAEIAHLFRYLRLNFPWTLVEPGNLLAGLEIKREARRAA
jgi:hypothetical protein